MKISALTGQKDTLPSHFFTFSAIKLKPKACDRSLTSFYCDHTDLTSTDHIQEENKSWPGNFFAGTMHRDCICPDQCDDTKNASTGIPDPTERLLQQAWACVAGSSPWAQALNSEWGALHTPQVRTFLLLHRGDSRWILHAGLSPDFLCIPPKARPQGGTGTPTQEFGVSEARQKFSSF